MDTSDDKRDANAENISSVHAIATITTNNIDPRLFLRGKIEGVHCELLVDTGATDSVLSESTYNSIRNKHAIEMMPTPINEVRTINGTIEVIGKADFNLTIDLMDFNERFLVTRQTQIDILGAKWLKNIGATVTFDTTGLPSTQLSNWKPYFRYSNQTSRDDGRYACNRAHERKFK